MTSKEIGAAIERLRGSSSFNIIADLMGDDRWTGRMARDRLIELLEQADPDTHMELPVDADGVPIHEGDTMEFTSGKRVEVEAVSRGGFFYFTNDEEAKWTDVTNKRHYHKPTVEDVLREFGDEVRRCCDTEDTITEYAAKLREVLDE